jgi:hypothetical protein
MIDGRIGGACAALLLLALSAGCTVAHSGRGAVDRYDDQVAACVERLARDVGIPLAAAPDFATAHAATAWVAQQLPADVRERLRGAGAAIAAATARDGFADVPAMRTALLGSTRDALQALPGCQFDDADGAVPREVLLDQITIGLALPKKPLIARLRELGVDDTYRAKWFVFYGVVLDLGGVTWTDEQLAAQVKLADP